MVSRIKSVQKNKKRVVTEELRAVLAERDAAVEKVCIHFIFVRKLEINCDKVNSKFKLVKRLNQFVFLNFGGVFQELLKP